MAYSKTVLTKVEKGGAIHVSAPELPTGQTVEVTIASVPGSGRRGSAMAVLAKCPGGRIFKTAAEVDAYIRGERDSWTR